jgi:hypothetical protein
MICETKPINCMNESEISATIWVLRDGTLETNLIYSTMSERFKHFRPIGDESYE